MTKRVLLVIACLLFALALWFVTRAPFSSQGSSPGSAEPPLPLSSGPARRPRSPAPAVRPAVGSHDSPLPAGRPEDWFARLLNGEWPAKPSREALEAYLTANGRSAEALLAAFRASEDPALFEEAASTYTNNAKVAFVALFRAKTPEERRRWLDVLRQTAPESALGYYLSAREYFNAGQPDQAIGELMSAAGKTRWQDYSADYILNAEEAYRAAGFSEAEAKAVATLGLPLPHLAQLKDLGRQIGELAVRYREAGDEESAMSALRIGLGMARQVSDGAGADLLIQELVGIGTERNILEGIDPTIPYDGAGMTVKERLEQLAATRDEIKAIGKQTDVLMRDLSEQDLNRFIDRWKSMGERAALQWLRDQKGIH